MTSDAAVEIRSFAALIPAGTAIAAPITVPLTMPTREVLWIEVKVPPGPSGLMGFNLGSAGQQVIPTGAGSWIVTSDESFRWDLTGEIDSGAWELHGYNIGVYPHTVYLRFAVILPAVTAPIAAVQPLEGVLSAPALTDTSNSTGIVVSAATNTG